VLIAAIGLHSMFEYPLWYAFFLLPTALAWGFSLGMPDIKEKPIKLNQNPEKYTKPSNNNWGFFAGLLMSLAGTWSIFQFQQIRQIFDKSHSRAGLAVLLERGQNNPLFAHYADYAVIMASDSMPDMPDSTIELALTRVLHKHIDQKVVIFLANRLAAQGLIDPARGLAQRLREQPSAATDSFFAPCKEPTNVSFQCQWPTANHNWREYANINKSREINSANLAEPAASSASKFIPSK
jgi:hypothetical protein